MRPIDADALHNKFCAALEKAKRIDTKEVLYFFMQAIDKFPTAEAEPVRHGRWEKGGYACGETEWKCSACGETEWRTSYSRMKFCMFCGAKMDAGGA